MGRIKRREIRILESDEEKEHISYCQNCLEYDVHSVLGERIQLPGEIVTADKDNWKQCHNCGTIYPKYEAKMESEIENVVETSTNLFDEGKSIIGLGDKRKKKENKFEKIKERIEKEKDEDFKAELKKGNTVEHWWVTEFCRDNPPGMKRRLHISTQQIIKNLKTDGPAMEVHWK